MKKSLQFILLFFVFAIFQACEGPEGEIGPQGDPGPQGVAGPTGPAGSSGAAKTFEFTYPLNVANNYGLYATWDEIAEALEIDLEVGENDAVLVYTYGGPDDDTNDMWSPIPQTFFVTEGLLKLNFNHSKAYFELFMQANFDLKTVVKYAGTYSFKIVVIPATKLRVSSGTVISNKVDLKSFPVNFNNYEEVEKYFKLPQTQSVVLNLK